MSVPRIGDRLGANEGLPLGYRRCEYLESTGTQYIDTGIVATNNTGVYAEWMFNGRASNTNNNQHVLSCVNLYCARPRKVDNIWVAQGALGNDSANQINFELTFGKKNISSTNFQNSKTINFNETSVKVSKVSGPLRDKVILGGYSDLNASYLFHGCIYSAKISEGTEIVRNLVPALDPNNRPCMFDTVTSTPLYNQGTGEFLYKVISPETAYIPANFTRVGYLESNGTQYIDTGIYLSNESEVKCEYMATNEDFAFNQALYGSFIVPRFSSYGLYAGQNQNFYYAYIGSTSWSFPISVGQKNTLIHNSKSITFNGQTKNFTDTTVFEHADKCPLFSASGMNGCFRVYSFSISCNGQLQCNLIPCLDGDNIPCMYDTVSQTTLYKAVGDQFLYGEDEEASKKLPVGYTKMHYLESTGTQWIDTDIKLSSESEVKCEFMPTLYNSYGALFGARDRMAVNSFLIFLKAPTPRCDFGEGQWSGGVLEDDMVSFYKVNKNSIDLNGISVLTLNYSKTFEGNYPCFVFAVNSAGSPMFDASRIYSFSISRNDELQLDLQPCLDPYGIPCMYDHVSKRPLYNEGDGDQFLYG